MPDQSMQHLEPAVITVWRIKAAMVWTGLVAGMVFIDIAVSVGGDGPLFGFLRSACTILIGSAWTAVIPSLRYRFWRYVLRSADLYVERGIWNRVYTVVPLRRIQHIDVSQDVIERNFDLGRLIVHTAGHRSSRVVVPGLPYNEAESLRGELKNAVAEDAV